MIHRYRIGVAVVAIVLGTLIFTSSKGRADATPGGGVFFRESFEGSKAGNLPDGWTIVYDGRGKDQQCVGEERGATLLQIAGRRGWSGVVRYDFDKPMPDKVVLSFRTRRVDGESGGSVQIGNGSRGVGVGFKSELGIDDRKWHRIVAVIDFSADTVTWSADQNKFTRKTRVVAQDSKAQWAVFGEKPAIVFDAGDTQTLISDIVVREAPEEGAFFR